MSQFYIQSTAGPPPVTGILTLSAEGGAATPPDGSNNFDFTGGGPSGGTPFAITDTVTFGIIANGKMEANAEFPHWQVISVNTQAKKSQGYLVLHNAGPINVTLPPSPIVGDFFAIADIAGGTFVIVQNAGDSIQLGDDLTTVSSGNITSTKIGDTLSFVCWASGPGASWVALQPVGSFEVN